MPTVSVIVPSHDDAVLLRACLAALAAQDRPADEILVVDNASTDDTAEVGAAAGARVVREDRLGVLSATAAGFDAATGELLLRLDADSVPGPDWIARVVAAFEEDPGLDALSGPGEFYGGSRLVHWIAENIYIGGYSGLVGWLLGHPVLFGSNLAIRATAWARVRERVHPSVREAHDDFDISINLSPDMGVRYDRTLRVGVSSRPFESAAGLWRRVDWAFRTAALNHREESMLARRRAWRAARRAHPRS